MLSQSRLMHDQSQLVDLTMTSVFTLADVEKHHEKGDCWLIINGKVYDVSRYAEEHPGGDQVLYAATGRDATFEFEDRGHSDGARELMVQFAIGDIDVTTLPATPSPGNDPRFPASTRSERLLRWLQFLLPLTVLALALGVKLLGDDSAIPPSL